MIRESPRTSYFNPRTSGFAATKRDSSNAAVGQRDASSYLNNSARNNGNGGFAQATGDETTPSVFSDSAPSMQWASPDAFNDDFAKSINSEVFDLGYDNYDNFMSTAPLNERADFITKHPGNYNWVPDEIKNDSTAVENFLNDYYVGRTPEDYLHGAAVLESGVDPAMAQSFYNSLAHEMEDPNMGLPISDDMDIANDGKGNPIDYDELGNDLYLNYVLGDLTTNPGKSPYRDPDFLRMATGGQVLPIADNATNFGIDGEAFDERWTNMDMDNFNPYFVPMDYAQGLHYTNNGGLDLYDTDKIMMAISKLARDGGMMDTSLGSIDAPGYFVPYENIKEK